MYAAGRQLESLRNLEAFRLSRPGPDLRIGLWDPGTVSSGYAALPGLPEISRKPFRVTVPMGDCPRKERRGTIVFSYTPWRRALGKAAANKYLIADIGDVLRNGKLCCPGCGKERKILYVTATKLSRCGTCIGGKAAA